MELAWCSLGHVMVENRPRLIVDAMASQPVGKAEVDTVRKWELARPHVALIQQLLENPQRQRGLQPLFTLFLSSSLTTRASVEKVHLEPNICTSRRCDTYLLLPVLEAFA